MNEREVKQASDALQKAVSAKEPAANIIRLLRDLQKGVKPSEELLRKTQVGKIVNKLKTLQQVDPQIPRLAADIVSQWRKDIQQGNKGGAASPAQNGSASPAPSKAPSSSDSKLPTGVPLDKRTWKTDKIDRSTIIAGEPARNNSIGLLYDGLVAGSDQAPSRVLEKAKGIERAIITNPDAQSSPSSDFYKEKIRSLYQNLKNKSNPELRQRILSGALAPERFATMTHEEMKSESQRAEEAKIHKENLNSAMVPEEAKSISATLECGKCKQKQVSFTQAQTRSADEPMTTFCECQNCGNRWKFS
ncbi:transcription elongation factor TFIIS [Knufia obscura]|uniref:Transcription elongation factor n=2 Tax=Knufia TaxID=430999 RepID=A0AAN8I5W4_9EURO|nr:transcription elongation factor TFIIS [Knufia obscura]KAK5950931.1 transcription elongation factor TFIIS [Knufia fluminis]